jgi:GNAT superfamily N-acetyltransferase
VTKLVLEDMPEKIDVTVTFLEMGKAPAHYPPLPVNHQLALLRAKNMPMHFYRYLIDRVGRRWHWVNALRLDDETLAARLGEPEREVRVLYLDGAPAGFFEIRTHLPDYSELAYFGLMEHVLGMGLGRWFLGAAIEACWEHAPRGVVVQTCTLDHPAALPLYQKLGFAPVSQIHERIAPMTFSERCAAVMRP